MDFSQLKQIPLYRKMMHPDFPSLYFIGLCQPQGCIWPLADYQTQIIARIIAGTLSRPQNLSEKIKHELATPHYRFLPEARHALEVDYHYYKKELLTLLNSA